MLVVLLILILTFAEKFLAIRILKPIQSFGKSRVEGGHLVRRSLGALGETLRTKWIAHKDWGIVDVRIQRSSDSIFVGILG